MEDKNIMEQFFFEAIKGKKPEHFVKPPLGLIPKWVRDGERLTEIGKAIERYVKFNVTTEGCLYKIPLEWVKEYNKHIDTVNKTLFGKEENKK